MTMPTNFTDRVRTIAVALFTLGVLVALVGWLLGKDPNQLTGVLSTLLGVVFVGEASAVGKRATTNPAVMQAEARLSGQYRAPGGVVDQETPS